MRKILISILILCFAFAAHAKEGMWIPSLLTAVYDDMKAYGMQLTTEDLYSVNHSSIKDAIVLFGGGCTGEIVSNDGLLFTNHHCGYEYIQYHSSLTHDYLKDGFWAKNRSEELVCSGLSVVFIVRMDDVTEKMRMGYSANMSPAEYDLLISSNKKNLESDYKMKYPEMGIQIKAFNYGNQYFAILTNTYKDIRLVGAPPSDIGKHGGDTDNWVWPRHTGDFSVFRIYADQANNPADYSSENLPYHPAHFLPISMKGTNEGDFSMVYGFPGRTDHLLTSFAVDYTINKSNPMRIEMREKTLGILKNRMALKDELRIKYAAKQSDIANAWKKWKGQSIGLVNYKALEIKQNTEKHFIEESKKYNLNYEHLLPSLDSLYRLLEPIALAREAFVEYIYYGPELFNFAYKFYDLILNADTLKASNKLQSTIDKLKADARLFYKDFDKETEWEIYEGLTPIYIANRNSGFAQFVSGQTPGYEEMDRNSIQAGKSIFQDSTALFKMLDSFGKKTIRKIRKDYFYVNAKNFFDDYNKKINPRYASLQAQINYLMQQYTAATSSLTSKLEWADANSTLRVSYGKIEGSEPRDGEIYKFYTTTEGILEKYSTQNPDFAVSPKLIDLYGRKVFGKYAQDGQLRVCFTGSNHTTGGNSGSPALNANGELTGINFDRSWESTMSDIVYNPDICRNIMVDIRYVLWVIDIYAGAGYLLDEMKLSY